MATFKKNTSMPSSSAVPKGASAGSRMLRALFFLLALATVCAASIGATWLVMTRMQAQAAGSAHESNAIASDAQNAKNQESAPLLASLEANAEPPPPPAPIFFELAPFTVTVDNDVTERILHVGVTLRLADELSRERLENYLPEARSRVLFELSKLNPEDLKGSDSRVALATAIAGTLSRPFAPQPVGQYVTDVLFTTFVVQ